MWHECMACNDIIEKCTSTFMSHRQHTNIQHAQSCTLDTECSMHSTHCTCTCCQPSHAQKTQCAQRAARIRYGFDSKSAHTHTLHCTHQTMYTLYPSHFGSQSQCLVPRCRGRSDIRDWTRAQVWGLYPKAPLVEFMLLVTWSPDKLLQ